MFLEPTLILELGVLGLITGFLAGLLGIGGGMVMVPFLTMMLGDRGVSPDLAVKMAIATSMGTIIFTSISSVRAHHKKGAVRWELVKGLAPGIVLGSFLASMGAFAALKGAYLALFFALFVGFSATQMYLDKKPAPNRQVPGTGGLLGAGGVIGFLSGMVGAGGIGVLAHRQARHCCSKPQDVVQQLQWQGLSAGALWGLGGSVAPPAHICSKLCASDIDVHAAHCGLVP